MAVRRIGTLSCLAIWLATLAVASQSALVWLDVPFVQQDKNACGAAALAMVIKYWAQQQGREAGGEADAAAILRQLYSEKARGIFASDMKGYLEQHGFRVFVFSGGWDDLKDHLAKGRPLIAGLGQSGGEGPLHYVVVAGLDGEQKVVMLNDPARRKLLKMDWRDFERDWAVTEHWTLLAVPR